MGADAYAPRNTIPAFELAISMGVDGVELDVNRSADDAVVVIHDQTIDNTSNGKGRVDHMTLKQLRQYDYSYKFKDKYKNVTIPTLEEVCQLIKPTNLFIDVEIKGTSELYKGIEHQLIDIAKRTGMLDRMIFSSFDVKYLINILKIEPSAFCAMIHDKDIEKPWDIVKSIPVKSNHPPFQMVDENYIENCHSRGFKVITWTVDDPLDIRRMLELGVDGIITNRPDVGLHERENYMQNR